MKLSVNKKKVGHRIYIIRNKLNLTLEQFGKLSNLNASKSIVLRWENGSSLPNRSRLEIIAKLGNMTVNELLYGSTYEFINNNFDNLLSDENKKQFYIPKGFAHGFVVLSDEAVFAYKCTDFYHPNDEGGLIYNDPDIGIDWPVEGIELIMSDKDTKWKGLKETFKFD